ncbi:MAG TPA: type II toxin-antitoxin system MqsA family antitoxin [Candidatus Kapabacteria bacterium]|nr:type II toxin-antitoxin system MqsA family antitoxin [Candidatus Kapabacteria bacterium]
MKCMYCKGKMERGYAPFHIDRNGYHLTLEAVPAWICTQCGEVYFEESEVERIQSAIARLDENVSQLAKAA